jgi:outer membrane protease
MVFDEHWERLFFKNTKEGRAIYPFGRRAGYLVTEEQYLLIPGWGERVWVV